MHKYIDPTDADPEGRYTGNTRELSPPRARATARRMMRGLNALATEAQTASDQSRSDARSKCELWALAALAATYEDSYVVLTHVVRLQPRGLLETARQNLMDALYEPDDVTPPETRALAEARVIAFKPRDSLKADGQK